MFFFCLLGSGQLAFSQQIYFESAEAVIDQKEVSADAYFSYPILSPNSEFLYFTYSDSLERSFSLKRSANINGAYWHLPEKITISGQESWSVVGMTQNGDTLYLIDQNEKIKKYVYSIPSNLMFEDFLQKKSLGHFFKLSSIRDRLHSIHVHPSGKIITFSSSKNGNNKSQDLHIITQDSLGNWLSPINLGNTINTPKDEITPFLTHDTNRLFFSSNGHSGSGDMDIFYADRLYNTWNIWSLPKNLSDSINSEFFDAYFSMNEQGAASFVSSRKSDNQQLFLTDLVSGDDSSSAELSTFHITSKSDHTPLDEDMITSLLGSPEIPIVLFEEGSSEVKPSFQNVIRFIADKIRDREEIIIKLIGHTDQTGGDKVNLSLSKTRAEEVKNLLIFYEILPERIISLGAGEQYPLSVGISGEDQSINRRVEIILAKNIISDNEE
ncbi:OmpA family protein [Tunicatimonas pelagia]|uniref:OmpA family protein n=1 Tax=Tunicatimonas pelagia TaxID=931531 RepID=UPI0026655026|nr:OmpA family protein [Tunicatimonas pelagia]WKN42318.1 OmpA family protein [Tunicatimonas pelagia]